MPVSAMASFGSARDATRASPTVAFGAPLVGLRRELFLEKMDGLVPWEYAGSADRAVLPEAGPRPAPVSAAQAMLRVDIACSCGTTFPTRGLEDLTLRGGVGAAVRRQCELSGQLGCRTVDERNTASSDASSGGARARGGADSRRSTRTWRTRGTACVWGRSWTRGIVRCADNRRRTRSRERDPNSALLVDELA